MYKLSDPSSQNRPIKEALHFPVFVGKTISSVDWPLSGHDSWGTSSHRNSWPLSSTKGMFMLSFPYRKYCHPDPKKQHSYSNVCAKPIGKGLLEADCTQNPRKHQDPRPQHILKEKRPSIPDPGSPAIWTQFKRETVFPAVPEHHSSSRC